MLNVFCFNFLCSLFTYSTFFLGVGIIMAGATTPESVRIYTPAVKERAPFSRKRKCVFDGLIVLPNE